MARILLRMTSFRAAAEAARKHCKKIRQNFDTLLVYTLTRTERYVTFYDTNKGTLQRYIQQLDTIWSYSLRQIDTNKIESHPPK